MPAIETDSLTKEFGDVVAVDGLDLAVEAGEVFGFLGPNGAGKSTTINMLLGFVDPTEGSATVLDHDAAASPTAVRQRTGVLPEGFDVYGKLTGREHVAYAVRTKGTDDDPDAILDRVGLDADERARAAGGYSTGMRQRLALGMALVGDPDLLILDEPSSGLDPTGMQEMRDIVREEAADGTTVFFSSHVLSQVEAVCDRVGIMREGSLAAVNTIDGLRELADDGGAVEVRVEGDADESLADVAAAVDGVAEAAVADGTVTATCTEPRAKVDVIKRVDEEVRVEDVVAEEASLEELFNVYTGDGEVDA